jgi:mannose-6-phosphate isomerase
MNDLSKPGPIFLNDNRVPVYYKGGRNISRFRQLAMEVEGPEDWVGSTCCLPNAILPAGFDRRTGISHTSDGYLDEMIKKDLLWWLGQKSIDLYGGEFSLLVKLLDAGERLPVHAHPTQDFAMAHLNSRHGKTEAWIIFSANKGAKVWLGVKENVSKEYFLELIKKQDVESMIKCLNEYEVYSGDVIYVPAGTLHAIGEGIFLVESQEPTSFSILCEYVKFGVGESAATLGLGWESAIEAISLTPELDPRSIYFPEATDIFSSLDFKLQSLFPQKIDRFFRTFKLTVFHQAKFEIDSMTICILASGSGELRYGSSSITVKAGQTLILPAGLSSITLHGEMEIFICQPPLE